jgi:lipid-A-disaccharide synthase
MKLFVSCGEFSGDHLAYIALSDLPVPIDLIGLGGEKLESIGLKSLQPIKRLNINGYLQVLFNLGFFVKLLQESKKELLKCDALLLIDYPGFNLKLLNFAKSHKIPTFYISPPQTWAWKAKRKQKITQTPCQVLFPFEQKEYPHAEWFGHPLLQAEKSVNPSEQVNSEILYLLPGSRSNQRKHNLSLYEKLGLAYLTRYPNDTVVWVSPELIQKSIFKTIAIESVQQKQLAIALPGTNNLNLIRKKTSLVCVYKVPRFAYLFLKIKIKTKYFSLVNLLDPNKPVSEFINPNPCPKKILAKLTHLRQNPIKYEFPITHDFKKKTQENLLGFLKGIL